MRVALTARGVLIECQGSLIERRRYRRRIDHVIAVRETQLRHAPNSVNVVNGLWQFADIASSVCDELQCVPLAIKSRSSGALTT